MAANYTIIIQGTADDGADLDTLTSGFVEILREHGEVSKAKVSRETVSELVATRSDPTTVATRAFGFRSVAEVVAAKRAAQAEQAAKDTAQAEADAEAIAAAHEKEQVAQSALADAQRAKAQAAAKSSK
jgi:hypothetical protein